MSEHIAIVEWTRAGEPADFRKGKYSRAHRWRFDGGVEVPASPSPSVIPLPWSDAANVDPEEAFVAAIASCHFLTFLWIAAKQGFQIDRYEDRAVGIMTKGANGAYWVSRVTLNPVIAYGGDQRPDHETEAALHHRAHEQCFIANSVKTDIIVAGFEH